MSKTKTELAKELKSTKEAFEYLKAIQNETCDLLIKKTKALKEAEESRDEWRGCFQQEQKTSDSFEMQLDEKEEYINKLTAVIAEMKVQEMFTDLSL